MTSFHSLRITYSGVASTAALVIALSTGGAYAANLIGTKQIAKGAVTTVKIHKNAVTNAKIKNGAVGSAKLANNSIGSAKLDAATRVDILPPWGTIPSGKTVVGLAKSSGRSGATAANIATYLVLPADAPLGIQEVGFGANTAGADPDPRCTGSTYAPSAPPGLFCIYLQASGYVGASAYPSVYADQRRAVSLNMTETAANTSVSYSLAWAYTAP